jgi:cobalt-zinc-cadmium efflux system membrane fusion protein
MIGALIRLLAIAAAAAAVACGEGAAATAADPAPTDVVVLDDAAQLRSGVAVAVVGVAARSEQTEAPAVVILDERRTARIGALVEGVVIDAFAEVGDRVRAGQVLAAMHSPAVHEAWAGYRKAIAERRHLDKELTFAIAAHERARRLYADKAISLQEVQRAEADRVAAEEALDMARTEVRRSEEELEHLGVTNKEDTTGESGEQIPVKTPMAGVVLERLITPGTTVVPGSPLYVVSDLTALWAQIEIDESLLSHFRAGQQVQLRVAAYPDTAFPGTVSLVGDMVNPKTRRITIRCVVPNADGRLKPQMFATAIIQQEDARPAVVVPQAALQNIGGRATVFIAEDGGRFRPRPVIIGRTLEGATEIKSGLRAGERIAVAGSFVLKSELLKAAPEK